MRLLSLIITLVFASLNSRADADSQTVPLCLAGFCLDKGNLPTEKAVRTRFGGSKQQPSLLEAIAYCYQFTSGDQKSNYGHFEFKKGYNNGWRLVTIRLSQESLCSDALVVHIKSALSTKEGIRLGSDESEIMRFYGQPKYRINPPPETVIRDFFPKMNVDIIDQYISNDDKDLSSARFYFLNNQLVGIEMSVDE
jgi:hypothetical protein